MGHPYWKNGAKDKMCPREKMLVQGENTVGEKTIIQRKDGSLIRRWFFEEKMGPRRGYDWKNMLPHHENGHMGKMSKDGMGPMRGCSLGKRLG